VDSVGIAKHVDVEVLGSPPHLLNILAGVLFPEPDRVRDERHVPWIGLFVITARLPHGDPGDDERRG
jgi:hypothetical protein